MTIRLLPSRNDPNKVKEDKPALLKVLVTPQTKWSQHHPPRTHIAASFRCFQLAPEQLAPLLEAPAASAWPGTASFLRKWIPSPRQLLTIRGVSQYIFIGLARWFAQSIHRISLDSTKQCGCSCKVFVSSNLLQVLANLPCPSGQLLLFRFRWLDCTNLPATKGCHKLL